MRAIIPLLVLVLLMACSDAYPGFAQAGYFKGDTNARIFIVEMEEEHDKVEVLSYARSLMHTKGRLTVAFFYKGEVPWSHSVTVAGDFDRAHDIVDAKWKAGDRWSFFYSIGIGGDETFADCTSDSEAPFCFPSR